MVLFIDAPHKYRNECKGSLWNVWPYNGTCKRAVGTLVIFKIQVPKRGETINAHVRMKNIVLILP